MRVTPTVSSLGANVLDTRTTDANGLALLVVADGAMVTAHHSFDDGNFGSETVLVLPADSTLVEMDALWDEAKAAEQF